MKSGTLWKLLAVVMALALCLGLLAADALGVYQNFTPKFAKKFCNIGEIATQGMKDYIAEVRAGTFPAPEHKYKFTGDKEEFAAFIAEYEASLDF